MNPLYLAMLQQPQGQIAQSGIPPFLPSPDQPNPFIASLMPNMTGGTIPNTPAESIGVANTATPNPLLSLLTQNTGNASPATSSPSYSNPFDAGITKAIEAAKESMKASQAQKGEALTSALTAMAKAASQAAGSTPWGMGRGAGIGRILATAAPYGVEAYTQSEKAAESQNLGLADYMVKLKATQQDALRQAFKDWKEQDYKDKTLKATTDHHQQMEKKQDQLYALKKQKYGTGESAFAKTITLNGKQYPAIESKQEHKMFLTDQKNAGTLLSELDSIERDYKGFREMVKDNWVDPQAPYYAGSIVNTFNDLLGSTGASAEKNTQLVKRKALEAKIGRFNLIQEKLHKGGVLTDNMIKRFEQKGLLPSLEDRPEVFEQKMTDLKQMVFHTKQAADMTLKTGYVFTPFDLEHGEAKPDQTTPVPQNTASSPSGEVLMRKPDGEEVLVHPEDAFKAEQQGFVKL